MVNNNIPNTIKIDTSSGLVTEIQELKLVSENDPILRSIAPEFKFDGSINPISLSNQMVTALEDLGGIGLSCCQVGIVQRMFVMGMNDEIVAFFNPKIKKMSESTSIEKEGCLSIPNLFVSIRRPDWIDVSYQDYNGVLREAHFVGLTARCFMHETDHLNGILITDIAGTLALQMAKKTRKKLEKRSKK